MNDNTENILINVEKCVPTLIMKQLSSRRAFCHFSMHINKQINKHSHRLHVDQAFRSDILRAIKPDMMETVVPAGIRQAVP